MKSSLIRRWESRRERGAATGERGVALVITLLLLSVITFMAIAFLVLSHSEKSSTSTMTDQTVARLGADTGLENALSRLVAGMMVASNEFNYGLLVPTNYINPFGFVPGIASPTNVNYDYKSTSLTVSNNFSATEWMQNIANLMYSPRAPVFVPVGTNLDFRFYLDLNRNGRFEPTGWALSKSRVGLGFTNYFTGDPQWVAGLEFPDRPHSANNRFNYRFTYIVLPESETLDVNYIHNYAKVPDATMRSGQGDGFFRNQGASTYEINLAGLLVDLNTNIWGPLTNFSRANIYYYYANQLPASYVPDYTRPNSGVAFDDALSLLGYRYSWTTGSLASVSTMFGPRGVAAFDSDHVDGYLSGPAMLANYWPGALPDRDVSRVNFAWSGADNTNHFFAVGDMFDYGKIRHNPPNTSSNFVDRLLQAGNMLAPDQNVTNYNNYTTYRLLSLLGTDSPPEPGGTINLNYDNLVQTNGLGIASVTNFIPWDAAAFVTNAANKMLAQAGFTFTTANIQIWPTNFYTASVHRILQLAANIYDASKSNAPTAGGVIATNGFPTVFRPLFSTTTVNGRLQVQIVGYTELTNHQAFITNAPPIMVDLNDTNKLGLLKPGANVMVYGIPLVIGARKGYPNFNELAMETRVDVTRKLEFIKRRVTDARPFQTNQMYLLSISNSFGVEAWNSYSNAYPRNLQMLVAVDMTATLTNQFGRLVRSNLSNAGLSNSVVIGRNILLPAVPGWSGFDDVHRAQYMKYSFVAPFNPNTNNFWFLTNSSYSFRNDTLVVPYQKDFERGLATPFYVPRWWLGVRTRLRFILYDQDARRIVDYVNLASSDPPLDLTTALTMNGRVGEPYRPNCLPGSMWATNRGGGALDLNGALATYGIQNQINASLGTNDQGVVWNDATGVFPPGWDRFGAENFFRTNLLGWPALPGAAQGQMYLTNRFFAPYAPSRPVFMYTSWQANDPLVHYTVGDLTPLIRTNAFDVDNDYSTTINNVGGWDPAAKIVVGTTTPVNGRYEPWGGYRFSKSQSPTTYNLAVKDPAVTRSDDWDFPTNKFPNVGWLGRVHRGTPWQTVYLKSPTLALKDWMFWSGNGQGMTNVGQTTLVPPLYYVPDAFLTMPTNDWRLLDIFSTAFNDNASRGKLSINQPGLAAWSAVLSGVVVLTNTVSDSAFAQYPYLNPIFQPMVVEPAGAYDPLNTNALPALVRIVNSLNNARATNNPIRKSFDHLGDILAVPELTVASPFLNTSTANLRDRGITDAAYERIPQQILGLLKCDHTPRFVIYSYGQALKPAPHSLVTSGPFFNLCTNYLVTAEVATRAVVRVDGAPNKPHAVIESFNVLPPD